MKSVKPGAILLLLMLILTACQKQEPAQPTYQTLPQVQAKYTADEIADFNNRRSQGKTNRYEGIKIEDGRILVTPTNLPKALFYDSGINIAYPKNGVKGIYLSPEIIADETKFQNVIAMMKRNGLNAAVIDFKDDYGQIVTQIDTDNAMVKENIVQVADLKAALKTLEANQIYPIARIVTFKDNMMSDKHPELSFHSRETGSIWSDGNGSQFINPYLEEVWKYNIEVSIAAAKMGFKEIQYDYVRFPEGFETFAEDLRFDKGNYSNYVSASGNKIEGEDRVAAITDFLKLAKEQLAPYGVKVGADVFGITAVTSGQTETTGIGQDFAKMAEQLDVISSMIYPSHWGTAFFGIELPDLHPYELVDEYMFSEEQVLKNVQNKVISRPWIQDFTDSSKPVGTYQEYGTLQVQAQINALAKHNIHEFLLWNANGDYSEGIDVSGNNTNNPTTNQGSNHQMQNTQQNQNNGNH